MERAIELAQGCDDAEHPVGAVVVKDGEIVGEASNQTHRYNDLTYHAERLAIAGAQVTLDTKRLDGCELYSTLEPCGLICAGPIVAGRLAVVVYGATAEQAKDFTHANPNKGWLTGGVPFEELVERTPGANLQIISGFMQGECESLFAKTPRSAESTVTTGGRRLHIISLRALGTASTHARFQLGEQQYDMEAPFDSEALLSWFPSYAARAPHCACCDRLIFPKQPVAKGHLKPEDSGLSHLSCSDTAAGYAGWLDNQAKLVPAFA